MSNYNDSNDIIYYNSSYTNTSNTSSIINYTESRNDPILTNPLDYVMSVVRFTVDGANIPIFNFASNSNGSPNNNYYTITLTDASSVDYTVGVIFVPDEVPFSLVPPNPIWSYQSFINMINTAYNTAYNSGGFNKGTSKYPPFIVFDEENERFYFAVDTVGLGLETPFNNSYTNGQIKVYMNQNLYAFFANFSSTLYDHNQSEKYNRIIFKLLGNNVLLNSIYEPFTGNLLASALITPQDYGNIYVWSELTKIVITSSYIPIIPEYITGRLDNLQSSDQQLRVISDYVVPLDGQVGAGTTVFIYLPTAEYRYINLNGSSGITKLDFQAFWQDRYNVLRPIYLSSGQSFTIKILFKKKSIL